MPPHRFYARAARCSSCPQLRGVDLFLPPRWLRWSSLGETAASGVHISFRGCRRAVFILGQLAAARARSCAEWIFSFLLAGCAGRLSVRRRRAALASRFEDAAAPCFDWAYRCCSCPQLRGVDLFLPPRWLRWSSLGEAAASGVHHSFRECRRTVFMLGQLAAARARSCAEWICSFLLAGCAGRLSVRRRRAAFTFRFENAAAPFSCSGSSLMLVPAVAWSGFVPSTSLAALVVPR